MVRRERRAAPAGETGMPGASGTSGGGGVERPSSRCQADHLTDWQHHGPTNAHNGAPLCAHHNRTKNHGFTINRDTDGWWHTQRPDGTEI